MGERHSMLKKKQNCELVPIRLAYRPQLPCCSAAMMVRTLVVDDVMLCVQIKGLSKLFMACDLTTPPSDAQGNAGVRKRNAGFGSAEVIIV